MGVKKKQDGKKIANDGEDEQDDCGRKYVFVYFTINSKMTMIDLNMSKVLYIYVDSIITDNDTHFASKK